MQPASTFNRDATSKAQSSAFSRDADSTAWPGRHLNASGGSPSPGYLRPWQRIEPFQPTQRSGRGSAQSSTYRNPPVRPSAARRRGRPEECLRHQASRPTTGSCGELDHRGTSVGTLPVGLFGASTGAAAALVAASLLGNRIGAVVSRGGRPDLAGGMLPQVKAPTLLIVGGADSGVIELNQWALERLGGEKSVEIVPGATHLFPEPGALEAVIELAAGWFERHLVAEKHHPTRAGR